MERECPPMALAGRCVEGKLRVSPKSTYLGASVYPTLLVVPHRDIAQLTKLKWLDVQTESVTISTMIYTEGIEVFTLFAVKFKFSRAGNVGVSFSFISYRDLIDSAKLRFVTCLVCVIVGSFLGVVINVRQLVKEWGHCKLGNLIYELASRSVLLVFAIELLTSWSLRNLMSVEYQRLVHSLLEVGGASDGDKVLSVMTQIDGATSWMMSQRQAAYAVMCVQFLQVILYMSAHPKMAVLTDTIYGAGIHLIHFVIIFAALFLMLGWMAHWMFGDYIQGFSTFSKTMETQVRIFFGEFIYADGAELLSDRMSSAYWTYAATFMAVIFLTLLNFFLAIIVDAFCDVKEKLGKHPLISGFFTDTWRVAYISVKWRLKKLPSRVLFIAYFGELVRLHQQRSWMDLLEPEDKKEDDDNSCDKVCAPPEAIIQGVDGLTEDQLAWLVAYYYSLSPSVLCRRVKAKVHDTVQQAPTPAAEDVKVHDMSRQVLV